MKCSRRGLIAFATVQVVGEVCAWTAPYILSSPGPNLWASGFILLLPGDVLGAGIVEKLLWQGPLTLFQMSLLKVPIEIAINAAVWWLCWQLVAKAIQLVRFLR